MSPKGATDIMIVRPIICLRIDMEWRLVICSPVT
jgi:hypothetical protein